MSSISNALGTSTLSAEIISASSKNWDQINTPLPLSQIGQQLGPIALSELEAFGAGLKNYITQNLMNEVRYIENKKYGDLVCPKSPSAGIADNELIRRFEGRPPIVRHNPLQKKFKPEVWKSFITPLGVNSRFLILSKDRSVRMQHDNNELDPGETSYPVLETDLAFDENGHRFTYAEARSRISDWSERNNVDIEALYDTESTYIPSPEHLKAKPETPQRPATKNHQKLFDFLAILTDEELRRLSIPADVTYRLLKDR